jgi:signal transduction histidine kinase
LWVQDTGIGVPEDDLPHIFDRFHRGRNTATYPGSGLGLAVVKAIVDAHGGTVAADNTASGARFDLRVPAAP